MLEDPPRAKSCSADGIGSHRLRGLPRQRWAAVGSEDDVGWGGFHPRAKGIPDSCSISASAVTLGRRAVNTRDPGEVGIPTRVRIPGLPPCPRAGCASPDLVWAIVAYLRPRGAREAWPRTDPIPSLCHKIFVTRLGPLRGPAGSRRRRMHEATSRPASRAQRVAAFCGVLR